MKKSNSYVYFAFSGDNFDPSEITNFLGVIPTDAWQPGQPDKHIRQQKYSFWKLTSTGDELLDMDKLVDEVINQLDDKIAKINQLKDRFSLTTVLEIVMYVDTNEEHSTPYLGHNSRVIDFLYKTGTTTDLDIYRFNSSE